MSHKPLNTRRGEHRNPVVKNGQTGSVGVTRRDALKRIGAGIGSVGATGALLTEAVGPVRADHGDATFLNSGPDIFNNSYYFHIATRLENTISGFDGTYYYHRFVAVGDMAATLASDYNAKRERIADHLLVLDDNGSDAAIYTTEDDDRTAGFPEASGSLDGNQVNAITSVIEAAVSTLKSTVGTAVSAATIAADILNLISSFYDSGNEHYEFLWNYNLEVSDATHQVYFSADNHPNSYSTFSLDSWVSSSVVNQMWVYLADHPSVYQGSLLPTSTSTKHNRPKAPPKPEKLPAHLKEKYDVRKVSTEKFLDIFPERSDQVNPEEQQYIIGNYPLVVRERKETLDRHL